MRRPVTIAGQQYMLDTKNTGGRWWQITAFDDTGRPVRSVEAQGNAGELERQLLAELERTTKPTITLEIKVEGENRLREACQTLDGRPSTTPKDKSDD